MRVYNVEITNLFLPLGLLKMLAGKKDFYNLLFGVI